MCDGAPVRRRGRRAGSRPAARPWRRGRGAAGSGLSLIACVRSRERGQHAEHRQLQRDQGVPAGHGEAEEHPGRLVAGRRLDLGRRSAGPPCRAAFDRCRRPAQALRARPELPLGAGVVDRDARRRPGRPGPAASRSAARQRGPPGSRTSTMAASGHGQRRPNRPRAGAGRACRARSRRRSRRRGRWPASAAAASSAQSRQRSRKGSKQVGHRPADMARNRGLAKDLQRDEAADQQRPGRAARCRGSAASRTPAASAGPKNFSSAATRKKRAPRVTHRGPDEGEEVELRQARGDGHQLVGDRRQALDQDHPQAPLGEPALELGLAVGVAEAAPGCAWPTGSRKTPMA